MHSSENSNDIPADGQPHRRRVRYAGKNPRKFAEKYKELQPEKYAAQIQKLIEQGQTPAGTHRPICVNEILDVLHPSPGEIGLDATLGFGGHAVELLKRIVPGGKLFATDVDPIELPKTAARLAGLGFGSDVFSPHRMNFGGIMKLLPETGGRKFDFMLADLGVSSMQLDNPARGFTFREDGPLDLRMNPDRGKPAAEMLQEWSEEQIENLLSRNADEPQAKFLAKAIFEQRGHLLTTSALAKVVRNAIAGKGHCDVERAIDKALPRVFQAFRIAVNGELCVLDQLLQTLPFVMAPRGRMAILTFHSGEDNRVAKAFAEGLEHGLYQAVSTEPIRPSGEERYSNPRSKCARLRWAVMASPA